MFPILIASFILSLFSHLEEKLVDYIYIYIYTFFLSQSHHFYYRCACPQNASTPRAKIVGTQKSGFFSFFFLLVRPPMPQSLLIMGWCSSIPEHWLRLHLDSGPIFNLSLLRWDIIPCISGLREFGLSLLCLRPAPLRPTGATGSL